MRNIEELKKELIDSRTYELSILPQPTVFDVEILRTTHYYIFQDFQRVGVTDPPPGKFRDFIPERDWIKERKLESIQGAEGRSFICYSPMSEYNLKELGQKLKEVQPDKLKTLSLKEFIETMSTLYAQLDYTHPFYDGNSRTLRTFTKRLAIASNYDIEWEKLDSSGKTRDSLYIARDRAVGEIALNYIREKDNKLRVIFCMDKFANHPDLSQLLATIIRPARAIEFEKNIEEEAINAYPELKEAYKILKVANKYFNDKASLNQKAQDDVMMKIRQQMQDKLNAGEIINLYKNTEVIKNIKDYER
jgi:cell filamentation protein